MTEKKLLRITLVCRAKKGEGILTTAENVSGPSFKCPYCGETLVYLANERRLSSHGAPVPNAGNEKNLRLKHELRSVTELKSE